MKIGWDDPLNDELFKMCRKLGWLEDVTALSMKMLLPKCSRESCHL